MNLIESLKNKGSLTIVHIITENVGKELARDLERQHPDAIVMYLSIAEDKNANVVLVNQLQRFIKKNELAMEEGVPQYRIVSLRDH